MKDIEGKVESQCSYNSIISAWDIFNVLRVTSPSLMGTCIMSLKVLTLKEVQTNNSI